MFFNINITAYDPSNLGDFRQSKGCSSPDDTADR